MSVVIPQNTLIPTVKEVEYETTYENQPSLSVKVYQGESTKTKDNIFLDEFSLKGVPPAPAGQQKMKVCFKIDAS
ncbi:heat shock cognate 70 kDa protein-like protein, partial [Tanacetum coccineum]